MTSSATTETDLRDGRASIVAHGLRDTYLVFAAFTARTSERRHLEWVSVGCLHCLARRTMTSAHPRHKISIRSAKGRVTTVQPFESVCIYQKHKPGPPCNRALHSSGCNVEASGLSALGLAKVEKVLPNDLNGSSWQASWAQYGYSWTSRDFIDEHLTG